MDAVLGLWIKARRTVRCRYWYLGTYSAWTELDWLLLDFGDDVWWVEK